MIVFYGKKEKYTSFELLKRVCFLEYNKRITKEDILFNDNGKPFFKDSKFPFFSISHSGDYIACVFFDNEIGLDMQKITKISERLILKFLKTESNDSFIQTLEWTKFESFGKMKGTGIPPSSDYREGEYLSSYSLSGYIITVCSKQIKNQPLQIRYFDK